MIRRRRLLLLGWLIYFSISFRAERSVVRRGTGGRELWRRRRKRMILVDLFLRSIILSARMSPRRYSPLLIHHQRIRSVRLSRRHRRRKSLSEESRRSEIRLLRIESDVSRTSVQSRRVIIKRRRTRRRRKMLRVEIIRWRDWSGGE